MSKDNPKCEKSEELEKYFRLKGAANKIRTAILRHLHCFLARDQNSAVANDWWIATAMALRDRVLGELIRTQKVHHENDVRRIYYMSLEYLPGTMLRNTAQALGILDDLELALRSLDQDFDAIAAIEPDMGLGNGGLGRLASCFQDSLATLDYPAVAYGIHYEFGLFRQEIVDGKQVERPDNWTIFGNPWQICRPENIQNVQLYGRIENTYDERGHWHPHWVDGKVVQGVPWDIPVVGYGANTVNFMRLWEARTASEFELDVFNRGEYLDAVRKQSESEAISKILYPDDSTVKGKELRLTQQYFFVSCSIKDILRRYTKKNASFDKFVEKIAIQLNDTHPTIAIVELLRLLLDEYNLSWDAAWAICQGVFGYANHTLLPEALEEWSIDLFTKMLPRHYQLICEINRRFLENEVEKKWPHNSSKKDALSIIHNGKIRMSYLAVVGSHSVNGVAKMHSELLKSSLFPLFNELYPGKFKNVTNGITPRQWLRSCNPSLSKLVDRTLGSDWTKDLYQLRKLETVAECPIFQKKFREIKLENKIRLARTIFFTCGIQIDPHSLFDIQAKRLHEYKRQHLNLLHILYLYRRILKNPSDDAIVPRTFIFAAKAAPGYYMAKRIIHSINVVAKEINNSPTIGGKIKVIFLPNYSVSLASEIIPAADLSEQISTAGKEASGTGNMKFALNGACTIGTLDGANVEIREEVGNSNIFIFGRTEKELRAIKNYNPYAHYHSNSELHEILDWIGSDYFNQKDGDNPLRDIKNSLLGGGDPFFVLEDFDDYIRAQSAVNDTFKNEAEWTKKAILNIARIGKFSSDRAIEDYATHIWHLEKVRTK
ncbi:MAG: glycogen/starch/alpha-glucan phosphorylase [Puniceicoccales bacterium]|jgi:starch phosphorylase|nr:glycogen/starch/alpha-glucan phosphorylase [Puniceicoccales bacterium]